MTRQRGALTRDLPVPVAPTMATRGGRGEADDIAIHRFVACSMDMEQVATVGVSFVQKPNKLRVIH